MKYYKILAIVELEARSLKSAYKKLDFLKTKKKMRLVSLNYKGAVKK